MNFTRVIAPSLVRRAIRIIEREFGDRGEPYDTQVGFQGGREPARVWWVPEYGIWLCRHDVWYGERLNRFWCGYGTVHPSDASSLPITVEINLPREGVNRRVKSLLALDQRERMTICHNGQLGGVRGKSRELAFEDYWGRERVSVQDGDGRTTKTIPVAGLDSPRLLAHIAEFVHACADYKAGALPLLPAREESAADEDSDEFEGTKQVPARDATIAHCDHGTVKNCLAHTLRKSGLRLGNDRARDLFVGASRSPQIVFEIKTGCDPQSIYSAIGQLAYHAVRAPAEARVAVLPDRASARVRASLEALEIAVVTYRWRASSIEFLGLDHLVPGVEGTAPLSPRARRQS